MKIALLPRPALAVALLCLALTARAQERRAPASHSLPSTVTYEQLELFARVLSYVENNYVEPVDSRKLMHGAIQGMLETLDPHTAFMPPEVFKEMKMDTSGEWGGLGMEVARKGDRFVVVAPMEDTPAARAGIRVGDEIWAIDGVSTQGMDLGEVLRRMRGPAGQRVVLTLMRQGFTAPRDMALVRDHIRINPVTGALHGEFAHVRVKSFQDKTDLYLRRELERLRGLNGNRPLKGAVLDLRNNPGGLLDQAVAVADVFLPGGLTIVSTRGRDGNGLEERSRDRDTEPLYPLVVLVNAGSASASEIVAGALQDHERATVLGTQTFGKGSVQTVIELEDGSGLKLTIARYYTPKGRSIQERGITPDYEVPESPSAQGAAEPLREKDLVHHFRAEPAATPATPPATSRKLPDWVRPWEVSARLEDLPLKAALEYLHGLPPPPRPASP